MIESLGSGVFVQAGDQRVSTNAIIATGDGLVLIDSPLFPSSAVAWRASIQEWHEPVRYLIYTDHHPDHTTGAHWLPGTVVAHAGTRMALSTWPPDYLMRAVGRLDPAGLERMRRDSWCARLPEITFTERLTLRVGSVKLELIHMPGHTANTIAVHLPDAGILFAGDNVLTIDGVPGLGDAVLDEHFATLDALEATGSNIVVPGHGKASDVAAIGAYRARLVGLVARVEEAIDAGLTQTEMLRGLSYPDLHAASPRREDAGYAPADVEEFQRLSLTNVYKQLVQRRARAASPSNERA